MAERRKSVNFKAEILALNLNQSPSISLAEEKRSQSTSFKDFD